MSLTWWGVAALVAAGWVVGSVPAAVLIGKTIRYGRTGGTAHVPA